MKTIKPMMLPMQLFIKLIGIIITIAAAVYGFITEFITIVFPYVIWWLFSMVIKYKKSGDPYPGGWGLREKLYGRLSATVGIWLLIVILSVGYVYFIVMNYVIAN